MKKIIASSLLIFLIGSSVNAQEETTKKCGIYEATEEVYKLHPELREHSIAMQLLNNSQTFEKSNHSYTIPVVFHILHEYGSENISDAQVYDAMEVINREFNSEDPDSVDVVDEFKGLIGNGKIRFKLAAIDPSGNCTNGIEHIYTHETNVGDGFSKVQQWNRAKYLNIWVGRVVGAVGAAAYAIKPADTDGNAFYLDGIFSNHEYVGSIGTSASWKETTITHEIAHYLNVSHVWGNTNDPEVICGDDGVDDTPVTKGHSAFGCLAEYATAPGLGNRWSECDTTVIEDVQNYMDYSYCSRHFTPGQVEFMHNALEGISGERNKLWNDTNLINTGVMDQILPQTALTVPLCTPVADFTATSNSVCVGSVLGFNDESWNAVIDNWEWTFQDGSPATSSSANPFVTFSSPGYKLVTLTVSNANGSDTESRSQYVLVYPEYADYNGPASSNMSGSSASWFNNFNYENNHGKFHLKANVGMDQSPAYKLNLYKNVTNADPFTNDAFYNNRLGFSKDDLLSPTYDLRYTTGVSVSFDYSFATNATTAADISETVKVYSSTDCGETWIQRHTIFSSSIVTAGFAGNTDFTPTSNAQWANTSFNYFPSASADEHTLFKIEFLASDLSSNFYVDNFNVNGTLSLTSDVISAMDINVFPNPTVNGSSINVTYTGQNEDVTLFVRNSQGKVISSESIKATNSIVNHEINNTKNLAPGCYFIEIATGETTTTRKVVVL